MNARTGNAGRTDTLVRWRFAGAEFDEARWQLTVSGEPVDIERKPLEVLAELLRHAGEVMTKDELLETVWPGRVVVEGALTNAIGKLRRALRDDDQTILVTVARIGYRLQGRVDRAVLVRPNLQASLVAGNTVPRRPHWVLQSPLDQSDDGEVWLAEHAKTHVRRVFKFSIDGERLRALKREATISRLLQDSLGDRPAFVKVVDWDFQDLPFFLESDYGGENLDAWAQARGGVASLPLTERLGWLAEVADAVADAHEIGILHKDLKPGNLLVYGEAGDWHPRVVDFGSGRVLDPDRLKALGITGLTVTQNVDTSSLTGTPLYIAPELLAGQAPSVKSDLYALGVVLYQLIVGDLRRPLSAGWENEIDDPLLREDIAASANGNPALRLEAVRLLTGRLRSLPERRKASAQQAVKQVRADATERALAAAKARRPWLIGAVAALLMGTVVSLVLFAQARAARGQAEKDARISAAMNMFLSKDLIGQADVNESGASALTLTQAIHTAADKIDQSFTSDPEVAARLHESIGTALASRNDLDGSVQHYSRAAELYAQALGPASGPALNAKMRALAKKMVDPRNANIDYKPDLDQITALAKAGNASGTTQIFYSLNSLWTVYYSDHQGDYAAALPYVKANYDRMLTDPDASDQKKAFARENMGFLLMRTGRYAEADQVLRAAIETYTAEKGATHPLTMDFRHRLTMSLLAQKRFAEAEQMATPLFVDRLKVLGDKNTDTIDALISVVSAKRGQGKWSEALPDCERALALYRPIADGWETDVLNTRISHALLLSRLKRDHEAQTEIQGVRKLADEHWGTTGEYHDYVLYSQAIVALDSQRWTEAAELLAPLTPESVAAHKRSMAGDGVALLRFAQARLAIGKGDPATAAPLLDAALDEFGKKDPPDYLPAVEARAAKLSLASAAGPLKKS
jgi:non-specific serine/threonine protein kinase